MKKRCTAASPQPKQASAAAGRASSSQAPATAALSFKGKVLPMGLKENLQQECVRDLPLREPVIVSTNATVSETIAALRERQIGCAIVVDDQQKPLGVFTERTVIDLALQSPDDWDVLLVKDHLDADYFVISEDDAVCALFKMVLDDAARFVCVVNQDGHPVAITGQKGLAEYVAEHFPRVVMVQRVGGKPGQETREGA
jgi:CBS domain-containing protein